MNLTAYNTNQLNNKLQVSTITITYFIHRENSKVSESVSYYLDIENLLDLTNIYYVLNLHNYSYPIFKPTL